MPIDPAAAFTDRVGTVHGFDEAEGAGTVLGDDGLAAWFHCTRIADGSRSVPVGAAVRYRIEPGPTGLEAVDVAVLPGPADGVTGDEAVAVGSA